MLFVTRQLTRLLGILLLVVGIGGFFTNGYISFIQVNANLNFMNIFFGIIGIGCAKTYRYSKHWLYATGILLAAGGIVVLVNGTIGNMITTNSIGAVAYSCLGVSMVALASLLRPKK